MKHPKHMLKLMGKKIFTIYAQKVCLSKHKSNKCFSFACGLIKLNMVYHVVMYICMFLIAFSCIGNDYEQKI